MTLLELMVKIGADVSSLEAGVARAKTALSGLSASGAGGFGQFGAQATKAVKDVSDGLETMTARLAQAASSMTGLGSSGLTAAFSSLGPAALLGAAGVGTAAAAVVEFGSVIKTTVGDAADFQSQLMKIGVLSSEGTAHLDEMGAALLDMAPKVGKGPAELADALYYATSAGKKGAEALDIVKQSAEAAAIGLGKTSDVTRLVTAAMTTYADQNLTANQAVNILTSTVTEAHIPTDALANALGGVISIAHTAGVTFGDLGAFIATFTRTGTSAREAMTALRGVLTMIIHPAKQSREALEDVGWSVEGLRRAVVSKGLPAAMVELMGHLDKNRDKLEGVAKALGINQDALGRIVPRIRGLAGVLGTAGTQAQAFIDIAAKNKQALEDADYTHRKFLETEKTLNQQVKELKGEIGAASVKIGQEFLPLFTQMVKEIKPAATAIFDLTKLLIDMAAHGQIAIGIKFAIGGLASFATGTENLVKNVSNYITGLAGHTGDISLPGAPPPDPHTTDLQIGPRPVPKLPPLAPPPADPQVQKKWKEFIERITGAKVIEDATQWVKALENQLNIDNIPQSEAKSGAQTMLKAIRDMETTGKKATEAYKDLVSTYIEVNKKAGELEAHQFKITDVMKSQAIAVGSFGYIAGVKDISGVTQTIVAPVSNAMLTANRLIWEYQDKVKQAVAAMRTYFKEWGMDIRQNTLYTFGAMLTGLTSFADGFKGIFQKIQQFGSDYLGRMLSGFANAISDAFQGKGGMGQNLKDAWGLLSSFGKDHPYLAMAGGAVAGGTVGYGVGSQYGKTAGILSGAASGAMTGMAAGPWGAVIGAGVGAVMGWWGGRSQEEDQKKAMEKDRASLLAQFGGMEKLKKAAREVGVDISAAFSTKDPEIFSSVIDRLTKALEAQKERATGVQDAFTALGKRVEAFGEQVAKLDKTGDIEKQRTEALKGVEDPGKIADINAQYDAQVKQAHEAASSNEELAASFQFMGEAAASTVAAAIRETGDAVSAYESVKPTVDALIKAHQDYGFELSATAQQVVDDTQLVTGEHKAEFDALSANLQIWKALGDAQAQTKDGFVAFGTDASKIYQHLIDGGVDSNKALALMAPTLQALWEGQKKFGNVTDASTQALIDQAEKQGLVGANMQTVNQKILDVLIAIGDALGAKIPTALDVASGAMARKAKDMKDSMDGFKDHALNTADQVERRFRTIQMPHFDESVVPMHDQPPGAYVRNDQTINVNLDGATVASATAPYMPGVLNVNGA